MTTGATLDNPVRAALKQGQSIWFDGLVSRSEFEKMIREDGVRGATTNPTIFEKEISGNSDDTELKKFIQTHTAEEVFKKIAVKAVGELADVFRPVYDESKGLDGYVSIEVNPLFANDTEATLREARELHALVSRPNVMVKVPATKEGIPAIETLISEGISINVTLIFSITRYREVMEAYLSGLEKRSAKGLPVSGIASVASFFVSRVDTAVDKELEAKNLKSLQGKAAIANSKLAYREFERVFRTSRFEKLSAKGARVQRPLWASTGTKNPAYSDVLYVDSLIGPDTVNTLPPATYAAFRDHGSAAPSIKTEVAEADKFLQDLEKAGISLDAVTLSLERAGVELFSDSHRKILQHIGARK